MGVFLQILLISVSLAMDAFGVSVTSGMRSKKAVINHALKIAGFFGIFQAGMPVIGWLIGEVVQEYVAVFAPWIGFLLLVIVGIKMLQKTGKKRRGTKDIFNTKTLLLLSIATSIDALVVGITLNLIQVPFVLSIATIGGVTFVLCFFGYLFGEELEELFGKKIEVLGGAALILIGCKILIEHLL